MLNENEASQVMGATAYGSDGEKIGKVGQVFLDDQSGAPEFLTVNTGLFGTNESFVPAQSASLDGDRVTLAHSKDVVKDAPNVDIDDGHLDEADEQRLYDYYNMGGDTRTDVDTQSMNAVSTSTDTTTDMDSQGYASDDTGADTGADGGADTGRESTTVSGDMNTSPVGHDTSGPTTDDAMTRSEEHLVAGTENRESGRARLRKYVTTEQETVTVPVRKERAVLETEPITDANRGEAGSGPQISEEEHEVVLHEEHAVVDVVAEPVERVRLGTETVVEDETVSADVREEHIELEGDAETVDNR